MANIDSPLFQYLQDIPEGPTKVAIEHLFDLMRQTRARTGGDSDFITEVQGDVIEAESVFNYDIRDLQRDRNKHQAERQTEHRTIQKISALESENRLLKAQINTQSRSIRTLETKLNQLIAEVATNA